MKRIGALALSFVALLLLFNALAFTGWFFESSDDADYPGAILGLLMGTYFLMWALPILAGIGAYKLWNAAEDAKERA